MIRGGAKPIEPHHNGRNSALLLLSLLGILRPTAFTQDIRFDVKVEMVNIYVTVQDGSGRLVTGLTSEDFVVYDNGIPQKISLFSHEYVPLSVLILLDTSGSMSGKKLENAKKALTQFLKRLQPGDEAMLLTFDVRPRIRQRFTEDHDRLRQELKRIEGNGSTALYDAIQQALDHTREASRKRQALLLISDGINTYGKAQLQETIARLRRTGVELFAIGLESKRPEDMQDQAITQVTLDQLTRSAGGEAFLIEDSRYLQQICARISDRMHNQYTFGYYPPEFEGRDWRAVRVETRKPGLRVIASKTGYYPGPAGLQQPDRR